jgi:energy-coupling factor transport system ATP-binding protein
MVDSGSEREADRLLEHAGLQDRKADHPYRLSWGQKRRLNVISAILHSPKLLLLDEPFAGQDWENATFLLDAIRNVLDRAPAIRTPDGGAGGTPRVPIRGACLMVTHDPRIVLRSCTRVLFISEEQLALDAPVSEAFDRLRAMGHDAYVP